MWKNIVKPDRPQTIRGMRIACWLPKATDTHSDYVVSTATMLTRKRLDVTFVHIQSVPKKCIHTAPLYWWVKSVYIFWGHSVYWFFLCNKTI
jgi:hypothetical protein